VVGVVEAKTQDVRGWAMRGGKTLDGRHEFADLPKFSKLMSLFPVACCNIIIHGLLCWLFEQSLERYKYFVLRPRSLFLLHHTHSHAFFQKIIHIGICCAARFGFLKTFNENSDVSVPSLPSNFRKVDWIHLYVCYLSVSAHSQKLLRCLYVSVLLGLDPFKGHKEPMCFPTLDFENFKKSVSTDKHSSAALDPKAWAGYQMFCAFSW
jgi:hypothetical protein